MCVSNCTFHDGQSDANRPARPNSNVIKRALVDPATQGFIGHPETRRRVAQTDEWIGCHVQSPPLFKILNRSVQGYVGVFHQLAQLSQVSRGGTKIIEQRMNLRVLRIGLDRHSCLVAYVTVMSTTPVLGVELQLSKGVPE